MSALDDKARLKELYLPPTNDFVFVDVPDMQFVMIDGEGSSDGEAFKHGMKWIFAVVYPLKRLAKERMGADFVEAPIEVLWWADDMSDFIAGNKDVWKWRLMIVTADWVDSGMFEQAVATVRERLGEPPESLRLDRYAEGRCVQIMHRGPENEEGAAVARRLYGEFLPQHGLTPSGHFHEIYLTDPSRVAPEKMRTVLRQPVR